MKGKISPNLKIKLCQLSTNPYFLALIIIIFLGFYLRVRNLGDAPFWVDEVFHAWTARNFLMGLGFSDSIGPASPYLRSWLTTSLPIATSFALLGESEFAARLPTVILGTLMIPVSYFLGSKLLNKPAGLLLALFITLDPFLIGWSREARMYTHLTLLYMLAILLFYRWYREDGLDFKSKNLILLVPVAILGFHTHPAFLAFGPIMFLFLVSTHITDSIWKRNQSEEVLKRSKYLIVLFVALGVAYIGTQGMPREVIEEPGEAWPERDFDYYWNMLEDDYSFLFLLFLPGLAYLTLKGRKGWLIILAFVIPFLITSMAEQKASRYILHLIPLFALISFSIVSELLSQIQEKLSSVTRRLSSKRLTIMSPIIVIFISCILVTTIFPLGESLRVSEEQFNVITFRRSNHPESSEWLKQHMGENDVIVSMRPELTMWYLGKADYFFRQRGVESAEYKDGDLIHTRTGTIYLDNLDKIEQVFEEHDRVWIIASWRFYSNAFTDPKAREFVMEKCTLISKWQNLDIYYWGPDEY